MNKFKFKFFCRPGRRYMESSDESKEEPPPKRRKVRQNGQDLQCYQFCRRKDHFQTNVMNMYITAQNAKYYRVIFFEQRYVTSNQGYYTSTPFPAKYV